MSELSPAARAVLDALCVDELNGSQQLVARAHAAAALRAAITAVGSEEMFHPTSKRTEGIKWCVQRIYAIADELEA